MHSYHDLKNEMVCACLGSDYVKIPKGEKKKNCLVKNEEWRVDLLNSVFSDFK